MTRCTLPCLALALLGVAGCSLDFDGLDPRLGGSGGQSSTTSAGGSTSSSGGSGGVPGTSSTGGSGGVGGVGATGGMGGTGGSGGSGGEGGSGNAEDDCIQMYGSAPGFVLCTASADSCSFNASTGVGSSCLVLCESLGGMCIGGFNNGSEPCVEGGMIPCTNDANGSDICVCSQ
jgi:hypothetical protein